MPSPKAADTPPELEMRSMAVSGGQSPARERTLGSNNVGSIRYTSGGREHVYGGPSGSGTDLCSCVLSWCSVCGLTPTERQLL